MRHLDVFDGVINLRNSRRRSGRGAGGAFVSIEAAREYTRRMSGDMRCFINTSVRGCLSLCPHGPWKIQSARIDAHNRGR